MPTIIIYSTRSPNLEYIYPKGYIYLFEGVHLRLAKEGKSIFVYIIYFQIFVHISVNSIFRNRFLLIVKYIYDSS